MGWDGGVMWWVGEAAAAHILDEHLGELVEHEASVFFWRGVLLFGEVEVGFGELAV